MSPHDHPFLEVAAEAAWQLAQGPGKRPAVFSHDKLVWQLCEDAINAARVTMLQPVPHIAPPYLPLQISAFLSLTLRRPISAVYCAPYHRMVKPLYKLFPSCIDS